MATEGHSAVRKLPPRASSGAKAMAWTIPSRAPHRSFEVFRHRVDVFGLVYVELEDGGLGVEAFGRAFREAFRAAEAAQDDLRPLLLGQPRRRVGYGAPVQDAGNQYLLAFEQSTHLVSHPVTSARSGTVYSDSGRN